MKFVRLSLAAMFLAQAVVANAANLTFSPENTMEHKFDFNPYVKKCDIDKDGDMDFMAYKSYSGFKTGLFEVKGDGKLTQRELDPELTNIADMSCGDINGDGNVDLLVNAGQGLVWFENLKNGKAFTRHDISDDVRPYAIAVVDADGDGKRDVVYSDSDKMYWVKNIDGKGGKWGKSQNLGASSSGSRQIVIADMNKDKKEDIILKDKVLLNKGGQWGTLPFKEATYVIAADFNRDGYPDLATTTGTDIQVLENVDGKAFSGEELSGGNMIEINNLDVADFDNDGDLDILSSRKPKPAVYLNNKGSWSETVVFKDRDSGDKFAYAVDIDGDKNQDVLFYSPTGSVFKWVRNTSKLGAPPKVAAAPAAAAKPAAKAAPAKKAVPAKKKK